MLYNFPMSVTSCCIIVRFPTVKEEFETLKWLLNRLLFYKANGYKVSLPDITSLCEPKALENPEEMFTVFKTSEYNPVFLKKQSSRLVPNRKN
jgi:hypothetical protein